MIVLVIRRDVKFFVQEMAEGFEYNNFNLVRFGYL